MGSPPSREIVDAIEGGRVTSLRRVEFYEADAATRWFPAGNDEPVSRLIDGNVSIDYGRDERRAFDMSLDNYDNCLRPNAEDGLWYDKVIKTFRGVRYATDPSSPKAAIIYEGTAGAGSTFRSLLQSLGFSRIDLLLGATQLSELADYSLIISHGGTVAAGKAALMLSAYNAGKAVLSTGDGSSPAEVPLIVTASSSGSYSFGVTPVTYDTPVQTGWTTESAGTQTGLLVTAVRAAARAVAKYLDSSTTHFTAMIEENALGGRWAHFQLADLSGTQRKILLENAYRWLWNYSEFKEWETQIGEFLIDNIAEDNFPHITRLSGRDFTKKCLGSKIKTSMSFAAGTPIELLVQSVGVNAGLTKFNLPVTGVTLPRRMDFDRTTERWKIMSAACESANYELYIDALGYLTMRPFLDPVNSPTVHTFQTGAEGNLVDWTHSVNDSRLYNHVVVTGDGQDEGVLPFFGEAENNEPSSPTRVQRIGDRSYFYTSSFFTNNEQCIEYANRKLKTVALESFELNWGTLVYPWLETGEIVEFLDPRANDQEPTRFLMDTLNIPLSLGKMGSTAKRVTIVSDSNLVGA